MLLIICMYRTESCMLSCKRGEDRKRKTAPGGPWGNFSVGSPSLFVVVAFRNKPSPRQLFRPIRFHYNIDHFGCFYSMHTNKIEGKREICTLYCTALSEMDETSWIYMQTRTTLCFAFERQREPKDQRKNKTTLSSLSWPHIGENDSFFSVSVAHLAFQTITIFNCYFLRGENARKRGQYHFLFTLLHECIYMENHACMYIRFAIVS